MIGAVPLKTLRYSKSIPLGIENKFNGLFGSKEDIAPTADLSTAGGIRTDGAGVAMVRERIIKASQGNAKQSPLRNWEHSVMGDIVRLARAIGGDVIFFEMPQSSYQSLSYQPDTRRADKRAFHQWALNNDLLLLEFPNFQTNDADFPDLLHMRASRTPEYSGSHCPKVIAKIDDLYIKTIEKLTDRLCAGARTRP